MICPRCKSKSIDVHIIDLTPYHWYLCWDCSYVWDEPGYDVMKKMNGERMDSNGTDA